MRVDENVSIVRGTREEIQKKLVKIEVRRERVVKRAKKDLRNP